MGQLLLHLDSLLDQLHTFSIQPSGGSIYGTTQTITPSSTPLEYPPVQSTSSFIGLLNPAQTGTNSVTISGTSYGLGTYITTQSSFYTGAKAAFCVFDKDTTTSTLWYDNPTTYQPSPIFYNGAVSTTAGGTSYAGEWVQIQLPQSIALSSFSFWHMNSAGDAPIRWVMVGSNDGTTWSVVQSQPTTLAFTSTSQLVTTGFSGVPYSYYRFIILANGNTFSNSRTSFTELKLFGN